nr:hypothetical protein [Tanacetum cinerariifolium]
MLEIRINILEARLELERHPEDHTFHSGAILYELLDDMKDLRVQGKGGNESDINRDFENKTFDLIEEESDDPFGLYNLLNQ